MKTSSDANRKLREDHKLINDKGNAIAIAIALIFVSSVLIGYYLVSRFPPEGYTTIYMLDSQQKKAIDYPELLVLNENSTFSVWVVIENYMGTRQSCEILQKVVDDKISLFPVIAETKSHYTKTIENGEKWETLATVSINELGSYSVVFELWIYDAEAKAFKFSYNYCVLNIEVVA